MKNINRLLKNALMELEAKKNNSLETAESEAIEKPRYETGFRFLDELLGGLKCGDLIVIGSRPAMGKTALALRVATQICNDSNKPCIYFSNEMTANEITMNILTQYSKVDSRKMKKKDFVDDDLKNIAKATCKLSSLPFFIDDSIGLSLDSIISECRLKKAEGDLSLVVVDYLQLIRSKNSVDKDEETIKIMAELKALALEINCPVIILSQLDRSVENSRQHRPKLSSLLGSEMIESIANVILFIYRDEVYNSATPEPGIAEIIIAKNREGETGICKLKWQGSYRTFEDL